MKTDFNFIQCNTGNLDQLTAISRQTFVDAFEKDNDPIDFKNYIDKAFSKEQIDSELNNPNTSFYFVYENVQLVGYYKLNANDAQTDLKLAESLELERIYVLKDFQGRRIGELMLSEIKTFTKKLKKHFLWLGVWEKNTKAIQFYQRHGFYKFGTHPYYIGNDKQTDWMMRFDLINFHSK